jgi:hypothetical protein
MLFLVITAGCLQEIDTEDTTISTTSTQKFKATTSTIMSTTSTTSTSTTTTSTTTTLSQNQRDEQILDEALSSADESRCLLIADFDSKLFCIGEIAKATDKSGACDVITEAFHRDSCILDYAVEKRQSSLCDVDDHYRKDICLLEIVKLKGDKSLCDSIKDEYRKELCFMASAERTSSIDTCRLIEDDFRYHECVMRVAVSRGDKSICFRLPLEDMADTQRRKTCEAMVAKDPSLCFNIPRNYGWWRSKCQSWAGEYVH